MASPSPLHLPLVAVDVGNTRIKFGLFRELAPVGLSEPAATREVASLEGDLGPLADWLRPLAVDTAAWWIGSVNRPALSRLLDWLQERNREAPHLVSAADLPLAVKLQQPDGVGIDRLLSALAANALRQPGRAAIVVDLGTAITIDRLSPHGEFEGGAILPGIGLAARALHASTDLLPLLSTSALGEPPPALGRDTVAAMNAGLYWGAVGGIRELIAQLSAGDAVPPQVFLTGGTAPAVARLLTPEAVYVPHLTLSGIALAAQR